MQYYKRNIKCISKEMIPKQLIFRDVIKSSQNFEQWKVGKNIYELEKIKLSVYNIQHNIGNQLI